MQRAHILEATAERYRSMAGTITDQDIARRLIDYADELSRDARRLAAEQAARGGVADGEG